MTTIAPTTAGSVVSGLWHKVDHDFWVGNRDGTFLGTIERRGANRYVAFDSIRSEVGVYHSLRDARTAIADDGRPEG